MRTLNTMPNNGTTFFLFLSAVICCILSISPTDFISAFQQQQQGQHNAGAGLFRSQPSTLKPLSSPIPRHLNSLVSLSSSRYFASADDDDDNTSSAVASSFDLSLSQTIRNRLRKVTGFSFTVFRATLRGITGISLTALYASSVAATGLWIRKTMSVLLGLFPSGFRYFLQPFLVLYYTPLILLRISTGPTRKRAAAKHEIVLDVWKEAVTVAEKIEKDGYSPVCVSEDGYFELKAPPSTSTFLSIDNDSDGDNDSDNDDGDSDNTTTNEDMANAMAATVEYAMEVKNTDDEGKRIK